MKTESWKPIPGFEPYEASDRGRIRRGAGILQDLKAGDGYRKVIIRGKQPYVHRLTALAWIGPIPERWEINHLNFNRSDNRPDNLEIVTRSQNMSHQKAPIWYRTQTRLPIFE